jgi:hypothetical protein
VTFRAKLTAIVAVNALALIALVLVSAWIERRVDRDLGEIQKSYLPRVAQRPRMKGELERIAQSLQDAAAAGDEDKLTEAAQQERALLGDIDAAGTLIADPAPLRDAIATYYDDASAIS